MKRFLLICCSVALLFSLVACTPEETVKETEILPYKETVTVSYARIYNDRVTYVNGENADRNFVSDFYKEKLNLVWNAAWQKNSEEYGKEISLQIATDTLPEVFIVSQTQLSTLQRLGVLEELSGEYLLFASERLKENFNSGTALQGGMIGDGFYGIPVMESMESDTPIMYLRSDLLAESGLSVPKTFEEFTTFLKRFGKGEAVFGPFSVGTFSFRAIAATANAYYDCWITGEDGTLVFGSVQPEMREALFRMQELYAEGLIDSSFAVMRTEAAEKKLADGEYTVTFGPYYYPHVLKNTVLQDSDANWQAYATLVNDAGEQKPFLGDSCANYIAVKRSCRHPEALFKSMSLWIEMWHENGRYRSWFCDKMMHEYKDVYLCGEYALPYFFDVVDNNVRIGEELRGAYESGDFQNLSPLAQFSYSFMEDESDENFVSGEGWALKHVYLQSERVFANEYENFQTNQFSGVLTESLAIKKTTLDAMAETCFTRIILGADLSEFDTFVDYWYENGGTEVTEAVNELAKLKS